MNQESDREYYLQKILSSTAEKKLIVAGPGTGKTHTFQELLKESGSKKNLVLTFINRLVDDLESALGEYATVQTFHKFCVGIMKRQYPDWHMTDILDKIICEDIWIDKNTVSEHFCNMNISNNLISLFLAKTNYYNAYSFNDSVFRVIEKAKINPEILGQYDNILIDEFQDFSKMEVDLIKLLESRGKMLIVGDDDQAIYDFKHDLGESLRELYNSGNYENFELPYCSRCPKVIVDSVNSIINYASANDYFKGRIDKRFVAYEPGKEDVNENYQKLMILKMASNQSAEKLLDAYIARVLDDKLDEFNEKTDSDPLVMIISNIKYLNKVKGVYDKYEKHRPPEEKEDDAASWIEAYDLIYADNESNFGWRLLMYLDRSNLKYKYPKVLRKIADNVKVVELLPQTFKERHQIILKYIQEFEANSDEEIKNSALQDLKNQLPENVYKFILNKAAMEDKVDTSLKKKYPIHFTNFKKSKGLAADHVFILGVSNGDLPKDPCDVIDKEICELIVGLTRVRKECYIMLFKQPRSFDYRKSAMLSWIPKEITFESQPIKVEDVDKLFETRK